MLRCALAATLALTLASPAALETLANGKSWTIADSQIGGNRGDGVGATIGAANIIADGIVTGNFGNGIALSSGHVEGNMIARNNVAEVADARRQCSETPIRRSASPPALRWDLAGTTSTTTMAPGHRSPRSAAPPNSCDGAALLRALSDGLQTSASQLHRRFASAISAAVASPVHPGVNFFNLQPGFHAMSKFPERVLSGIQPTGALHLGNYLGAMAELGPAAGPARTASSASSTCTRSRRWQDPPS